MPSETTPIISDFVANLPHIRRALRRASKAPALISASCPEFAVRIVEELERENETTEAVCAMLEDEVKRLTTALLEARRVKPSVGARQAAVDAAIAQTVSKISTASEPPTSPESHRGACQWIRQHWHEGLKIAGADSNYIAFWAFVAGVEHQKKEFGDQLTADCEAQRKEDIEAHESQRMSDVLSHRQPV
jgi:hypothetical protein